MFSNDKEKKTLYRGCYRLKLYLIYIDLNFAHTQQTTTTTTRTIIIIKNWGSAEKNLIYNFYLAETINVFTISIS